MPDERYQQYDLEGLRRRIPEDKAEFFVGFVPWEEDCEGWIYSARERLVESADRPLLRSIWNNPQDRDSRVLIDVVECHSAAEAMEALVDRLINNQLARVPEGPRTLGEAAFVHPEGAPPAAFFVRGNLAISVVSFGRKPVAALRWAERLNARLGERPEQAPERISFASTPSKAQIGQETALSYESPYRLGEDGYWKFFATGATLVRREGRLHIRAAKPGVARLEVFAVESGREPYSGRLAITVE